MNWIDKVLYRLSQPYDFTWPGIFAVLVVVGLCALLASILR